MKSEKDQTSDEKAPRKVFFDKSKVSSQFIYEVFFVIGVLALVGLLLVVLWQGTEVLLLVFAGLLLAVFLRTISNFVSRYTPLSNGWAMALVLLTILGLLALGGWYLYSPLKVQFEELTRVLPQAIENLRTQLSRYEIGQKIENQIPDSGFMSNSSSNVFGRITGFFSSFFGALVNFFVVLVVGIYFAFNPKLYHNGLLKLFPTPRQERVEEILHTISVTLRRWLVGRISVMTINGTLTAIGLWFLGVPLPVPLGILTALLNFIPNIGPILAAIPALLLALMQDQRTALYTALLYLFIQNLEGFVLTPLVQQRAISLPPVLIISFQLLFGILFGFLGVLLAVPLLAIFYVLVQMLYVEDVLGHPVEFEGLKKSDKEDDAAA